MKILNDPKRKKVFGSNAHNLDLMNNVHVHTIRSAEATIHHLSKTRHTRALLHSIITRRHN